MSWVHFSWFIFDVLQWKLGSFAHHGSFMMFFNELGSLLMVLKVHRFILGKMAPKWPLYEETNLLTSPLVHNLHNFGGK
jgi:hypothetical protein